jgi:hypothetical protein
MNVPDQLTPAGEPRPIIPALAPLYAWTRDLSQGARVFDTNRRTSAG